jgi:hypothetical protein
VAGNYSCRNRIGQKETVAENITGVEDLVAETEEEREIVWQKKNMRGKDSSRMRDRNREIEAYSE